MRCRLLLTTLIPGLLVGCAKAQTAPPAAAPPPAATAAATDPAACLQRLGVKGRLLDSIDCANPADPHELQDQGTSRVVEGPAGRYRITAAHRHAFFSYRYRTAGRDRPVLLVIEYPDDATRTMSFMTHDSARPGRPHLSFSQEGGVYTGPPLPVSDRMRTFTYLTWPQDDLSPLIVMNLDNRRGTAAASRIWAYAVEAIAPPRLAPPDPARQRFVDLFFPLSFLLTRDNFGWKSPQSPQHLVDYCRMVGLNRVTLMVYANQSWGAMCTIPSWDATEPAGPWSLDSILETLDRAGDVGLVAGIVATGKLDNGINGMYGTIKSGGRDLNAMPAAELRATVLKGLDEFLERYGQHRSLVGLSLGSMETIGFWELLQDRGILAEVVAHLKQRRPDLMVQTYFGHGRLQVPYFDGQRNPVTEADVVAGWEQQGGDWSAHVGAKAFEAWRQEPYRHDPAAARRIPGLTVFEMSHPDDQRLQLQYRFQPRAGLYHDVVRSPALSDAAQLDHAAIFATFTEGHVGLKAGLNFWHDKLWTAPDLNGPGALARMALATALGHRDRLGFSLGAWTVKTFGWEPELRRFIAAWRALPPVLLADVPAPDGVRVRWVRYRDRRYVSVLNVTPFDASVTVDGRAVALEPYDLVTLGDEATAAPQVTGEPPTAYRGFVAARLERYRRLYDQVRAARADAAPEVYQQPAAAAERLLGEGRPHAADLALGWGLEEELALRAAILNRPVVPAPRINAPPLSGDLAAWPAGAADIQAGDGSLIPGHLYFPNSWTGPDDLSMRIRLGHDGTRLYVGIAIRDSVAEAGDGLDLRWSPARYQDVHSASAPWETHWAINRPTAATAQGASGPFRYTIRATPGGWLVEGSAALRDLGVSPGGTIGFQAALSDKDQSGNLASHNWAVKQAMLYPHEPNFAFWSDARNLGQLQLAP